MAHWISSDKTIEKQIIKQGEFGDKPNYNSFCSVIIKNIVFNQSDVFVETNFVIKDNENIEQKIHFGETDTALDRKLEILLETMLLNEISNVKIFITSELFVTFEITLQFFQNDKYFHELTVDKKLTLATIHKDEGNNLFKNGRYIDAFYRFKRGIHLILSCVLEVDDEESKDIDGVELYRLEQMKAVLYGNLASCQLKVENYEEVIVLCCKVLALEPNNFKAFFKRGRAFVGVKDWESAERDFVEFLRYEPNNAFIKEQLVFVRGEIGKATAKFAKMCEKMLKF